MKVPLSPNQPPNQPTNQPVHRRYRWLGCAAWWPCPHQICPLCLAERPAPARSRCRTCSWDAAWNPCTWNWHMSSTYCIAIFHKHTATTCIHAEADVVSLTSQSPHNKTGSFQSHHCRTTQPVFSRTTIIWKKTIYWYLWSNKWVLHFTK